MNPLLRHPCGGVHGPTFFLGRISRLAQSSLNFKIHDGGKRVPVAPKQELPPLLYPCNLVFNKPFKRVNMRISVYRPNSRRNFFNESLHEVALSWVTRPIPKMVLEIPWSLVKLSCATYFSVWTKLRHRLRWCHHQMKKLRA